MTVAVAFTVHETETTREVQLRVSEIANGWVIKAGGAPHYCKTEEELQAAIAGVVRRFCKR